MTSLARKLADRVEELFDVHLFRRSSGHHWPEAEFSRLLFRELQPDCVFDVGANAGQYGAGLRSAGFSGTILSFEPNPRAFARLAKAAAPDPGWHCYPYALGSREETRLFNVMEVDVFSSFREASHEEIDFADQNVVSETLPLKIETLDGHFDALQAEHGFRHPFLKMDTQGFDLEVLDGAQLCLARFRGFLTEASVLPIYKDMPSLHDMVEAGKQRGFHPVELFNVHPGKRLHKLIECNCYFVRSDLLPDGLA